LYYRAADAVQPDTQQGQTTVTRQSEHISLNLVIRNHAKHTHCKYIQNKWGPSEPTS